MCCAAVDESTVADPASANCRRVTGSSSQSVAVTPSGASAASTERPVTPPPATSTGVSGLRSEIEPRIGAIPRRGQRPPVAASHSL